MSHRHIALSRNFSMAIAMGRDEFSLIYNVMKELAKATNEFTAEEKQKILELTEASINEHADDKDNLGPPNRVTGKNEGAVFRAKQTTGKLRDLLA